MPLEMYTIQYRKGISTIVEVEMEELLAMEDPSIMWLNPGEFKAKVLKPESLYEKQTDGSLTPPIWYWHAFYVTIESAFEKAYEDIKNEMERVARKGGPAFDETLYAEKCSKVLVEYL